jgi:hypothetical protein
MLGQGLGAKDTAAIGFVHGELVLAVGAPRNWLEQAHLLSVTLVPQELVVAGILHILPFYSDVVGCRLNRLELSDWGCERDLSALCLSWSRRLSGCWLLRRIRNVKDRLV